VQLAANSRLHIVQFRIDAVAPSDDLEYYLSGPHWLDAVTPPLENHLGQLKSSIQALLALPRAGETEPASPPPSIASLSSPQATPQSVSRPPTATPVAATTSNIWKWVALAAAAIAALGCVAFVIVFVLLRPHPTITAVPPSSAFPVAPSSPVILAPADAGPSATPRMSVAPPSGSSVLTTEEAERFVKEFSRDMEHGDLQATSGYWDDTVEYYAFGPKPKAFIAEQLQQYFAAVPVRTFSVSDVKVQPGPKATVATVVFDTHYSIRDALGNPASGRTHTEWDVVRRANGLKIARTNWMVYPDAPPPR
jgi:hypothetical protein